MFNEVDCEVMPLVNVLKCLPGINVNCSTSENGKGKFKIFFSVSDLVGLFFLTRSIDRRYWKYGDKWSITLSVSDVHENGVLPTTFLLESVGSVGYEAFDQSKDLIRNLVHHLNHENFKRGYCIDLTKFKIITKENNHFFNINN